MSRPARIGAARRALRRGAAAMEFAFWLVAFFIVMLATIDLAWYLNTYIVVQRAVRDGARHASTVLEDPPATGDDIETAGADHARLVLNSAGYTCSAGCTVTATWSTVAGYSWIDVVVQYPVSSLTGMYPYPLTSVQGRFSMMTQQQP